MMMMMKKIEMMEAKLWFALCALLLVNMGSADKDANATTVQTPEPTNNSEFRTSMTQQPSVSHGASNLFTEAPGTGTNATNTTGTFSTPAPHTTQSTSNHTTPLHDAITSSTPSNNSTQNETSSPTSVSAPNATTAAAATAASTVSTSAFNATSSRDATTYQPSTAANQATSKLSSVNATTLPNITSTQAESSPQLTIKGSNSPDSPRLDPLLVGLVSAFIIAAIVITLLLFLKFRRRQSGPQFHRLQDLPMDDMMEETPLSMYSY
ncbi:uncharacterized protein YMR317W-like [Xiphophorus hellerii]|uniref:uncharacterized protein YMR317W-like n=1 Tax=Xiphophorus hellerii TaxID=8084 RepID=UPI0013B36B90|nr:uncharacterized protein YMR317W-like [Xiphophorus hellerii]